MAGESLSGGIAGGDVEHSEQGGRPAAIVVAAAACWLAGPYWQRGLAAIQGLDLRLLLTPPVITIDIEP